MATVVILPGGFHPYHAGHYALYQSAQRAFPDADVYVAATDDRSARPFPFKIKEKLAYLAGVEPGHFVQVKSPFRADEITSQFNPEKDTLIFVRSTKDAKEPPHAGGVKKDGKPAYLQPLLGAKRLEPFNKHAYMAYLPTVEFGPGITSASEIRVAWPKLNDKRKTAMVMSLYPKTKGNPQLAAAVVKMLDTAIVSEEEMSPIAESTGDSRWDPAPSMQFVSNKFYVKFTPTGIEFVRNGELVYKKPGDYSHPTRGDYGVAKRVTTWLWQKEQELKKQGMGENQGWAATFTSEETRAVAGQQGAGMTASYQRRENQPVDEDYIDEKWSQKYKRSIDCSRPRGFSQRAHCAGRKK